MCTTTRRHYNPLSHLVSGTDTGLVVQQYSHQLRLVSSCCQHYG